MTDKMQSRLRRWARADVWGGNGDAGPFLEEVATTLDSLVEALRECECELNGYYHVEYGGDHPHSRKKLKQAIALNPATLALAKLESGDE